MHVICTAGHVDHGKSTLVRALTGIEPDRLAEEQARGLTIDIGYAWTQIDSHTVAFVDLPGHERFIANMLAGAGATRMALFVVAADEGWMPQSAEHLAILDLLGIQGGVIAVTRSDLVDAETQDLAVELVREEVAGTVLAHAPVLPVSAVSGKGLDDLRDAMSEMMNGAAHSTGNRPRLWIDRSFTIAGAGTVVTGTLAGGSLSVGNDVEVHGADIHERAVRVRGLQQLHSSVETAAPGRVAINLVGVPRTAVGRGDSVVSGPWVQTEVVDAWARSLGDRPLRRRGAWHVHVGSAERVVQLQPWREKPGTEEIGLDGGMLRMRFSPALTLQPGDRFVLREAGARETVGGGHVLDVAPSTRPRGQRGSTQRVTELLRRDHAVSGGDRDGLAEAVVAERGIVPAPELAALVGACDIHGTNLVDIDGSWADPSALEAWRVVVADHLQTHHSTSPLSPGPRRAEVSTLLRGSGCPAPERVLSYLIAHGDVAATGAAVHIPGRNVALDDDQLAARQRFLEALDAQPMSPPDIDEAARVSGASIALLRVLQAQGDTVKVTDRIAFSRTALESAVSQLRELFVTSGPFSTASAREQLGTSRKYAIPLLEELDRRGITRRVGDARELPGPLPHRNAGEG